MCSILTSDSMVSTIFLAALGRHRHTLLYQSRMGGSPIQQDHMDEVPVPDWLLPDLSSRNSGTQYAAESVGQPNGPRLLLRPAP